MNMLNTNVLILILQIFSISSGSSGSLNSLPHDILRDVDDPFLVVLKRFTSRRSRPTMYTYSDFSDSEAQEIVDRHNFHRSNPRESASNMRLMVRNPTLCIYLKSLFPEPLTSTPKCYSFALTSFCN